MASGCIPIVHNSGGPKEIVPEDLRYTTVEEAAVKIENAVLGWSAKKSNQMADIAKKFDEKEFSKGFLDVLNSYIKNRF